MAYPKDLVIRVNEVYHDVEGRDYENTHPEIFIKGKKRWENVARDLGAATEALRVLDVGSGTGFVPSTIAKFLGAKDTIICSDVSEGMLEICKENFTSEKFKPKFEFVKLDGTKIPLDSGSIDYALMNSVLHHIPNWDEFFAEIDRVMKLHGQLIMDHEPNKEFYAHPFLWGNYKALSLFLDPKGFWASALRRVGLLEPVRTLYGKLSGQVGRHNRTVARVNERLLGEGSIKEPLTSSQLTEIIDIQSPIAGGYHKERGISLKEILQYIPNFIILSSESYNYLGTLSVGRFLGFYESFLRNKYPGKGSSLFFILEKFR